MDVDDETGAKSVPDWQALPDPQQCADMVQLLRDFGDRLDGSQ